MSQHRLGLNFKAHLIAARLDRSHMEIVCVNRREAEQFSGNLPYIHICFHDPGTEAPNLVPCPGRVAVLFVAFDDISFESDCDITFSQSKAEQVAKFAIQHGPLVGKVVVNCEAGISRSAGAAAALDEHFNNLVESDFNFRSDLFPNTLVHRKIKGELERQSREIVHRASP